MARKYSDTEKLIQAVKERPCLYDHTDGDYADTHKKEQAWHEVCTILDHAYDTRTLEEQEDFVKETKTRWKSLRDQFIEDLRKIKQKNREMQLTSRSVEAAEESSSESESGEQDLALQTLPGPPINKPVPRPPSAAQKRKSKKKTLGNLKLYCRIFQMVSTIQQQMIAQQRPPPLPLPLPKLNLHDDISGFCHSIYGDLKSVHRDCLFQCKMDIMLAIQKAMVRSAETCKTAAGSQGYENYPQPQPYPQHPPFPNPSPMHPLQSGPSTFQPLQNQQHPVLQHQNSQQHHVPTSPSSRSPSSCGTLNPIHSPIPSSSMYPPPQTASQPQNSNTAQHQPKVPCLSDLSQAALEDGNSNTTAPANPNIY
ncbi:uncharacterized protein [Pyxicephalus adspersus]|uniref:uncharacterized protein n=1 Tax=Pyxicephalus adspersus TaxID=30357 RepID=UPI003B5C4A5E